ncbi:MAG: DNA primase [Myxococcales bacterium]|nr:DNA primase [Myxococcales bacterium]MCB9708040.1 DNA primase [Myxococcales bacterium]
MIPDAKVAEIRERTDISSLVSEYVRLQRSGGSAKGLCPFHAEKTPSFHVHPGRQFFHCFGCQASGDVFTFFMRIEGHSFNDAVRILAERAGVELEVSRVEASKERESRTRKQRLYALLDDAAGYFIRQLRENPMAYIAKAELERRGVNAATAETFRLGYAPHGWDHLVQYLAQRDYSPEESEQCGLIVPRRSENSARSFSEGHYDRFRHRLMFPVSDTQGRIIAFSGRLLPDPENEGAQSRPPSAKYINSPEHSLFRKGEVLFGLHEARVAIRQHGVAVLCEGNFDVLALHQSGVRHVAAPLGTALTDMQVRLLRRFAERVILIFDNDAAGRKAMRNAYPHLSAIGLKAQVVMLPPGSDPDSFLSAHGEEALRQQLEHARGIIEFIIDDSAEQCGSDAASRAQAIVALAPILKEVGNPIEMQLYTERIARRFAIHDIKAVEAQLRQAGVSSARSSRNGVRRAPTYAKGQKAAGGRRHTVEWLILGAFIDNPDLFHTVEAEIFGKLLTDPQVRVIFEASAEVVKERGYLEAVRVLEAIGDIPARSRLERRLTLQKHDPDAAREVLQRGLHQLAKQKIERELPALARQVKEARSLGNEEQALELTKDRDRLFRSAQQAMQIVKG